MDHSTNLPRHVAIIMDGNGRWAEARNLPRAEGHRRGIESIRDSVEAALEAGVPYLTLYAFSKENWARPKAEVSFLMLLLSQYLDSEIEELAKNEIRFNAIGCLEDLPKDVRAKIERNMKRTGHFKKLVLTLALSYSARIEIVEAARRLAGRLKAGMFEEAEITESAFAKELYTAGMPDPDLLIRTSGEFRLSNFLLWQISYAELYVSEKCWPDFRKPDFLAAVSEYQKRERRFGQTESRHAVSKQTAGQASHERNHAE